MTGKIKCIDGIKGISACALAFVYHYGWYFAPQNGLPLYNLMPEVYIYGYYFVEVFFLLSGFGIVMGYEKRIVLGEISFKKYLAKRLKSLAPIGILTLLTITVLEIVYKRKTGEAFFNPFFDVYHFVLNLYGIQSGIIVSEHTFNRPAWTISLTIMCYILFYLVVSGAKKHYDNILFIYAGCALIGLAILNSGFSYPIVNSDMGRGISCFFIGALLCRAYIEIKNKRYAQKVGYLAFVGALILWGGAKVFTFKEFWGNVQMVVILAFAPLVITSILLLSWLNKIFASRFFVWLGEISLSVYLWHMPVVCMVKNIEIYCLKKIDYSSYLIWILYIMGVIGIASIYHNMVEEKYIKFLKWMKNNW